MRKLHVELQVLVIQHRLGTRLIIFVKPFLQLTITLDRTTASARCGNIFLASTSTRISPGLRLYQLDLGVRHSTSYWIVDTQDPSTY